MTDLEDRLRSTLSAWADEAPAPTAWDPAARVVPLVPPAGRRRVATTWLTRAAAVALLALVATLVVTARDEGDPVTTDRGPLTGAIRVGEALGVRVVALDDASGMLFVASENDGRLYRIDPDTDEVTEGPELWARDIVGAAGGSVYAVLDDPIRVVRLDASTFEELASAEIAGTPASARPIAGRLWVRTTERELVRMDLETLAALPAVSFDHGPGFLAEGPAGVWLTDLDADTVSELDPDTGTTLRTVEVDGSPRGVAVGEDEVWVADELRDSVVRIDAGSLAATVVEGVGRRPNGVAIDGDRVWITTFGDGRLVGIDRTAGEILTTVPVGLRPGSVLVSDESVWVSVHQRGSIERLDRDRLRGTGITTPQADDTMVELDDGAHVFMRCMGTGSPTIVLEARAGADIGEWAFVQPALAEHTRVCAYDRATVSTDEPPASPRSGREVIDELRAALAQAGEPGPYVLVGDGHGSLYARLFAAEHPTDVVGVVLIDPMSPTFVDEVRPLLDADDLAALDESFEDLELQRMPETFQQVISAGGLGDLPLTVLVADEQRESNDPIVRLSRESKRAEAGISTRSSVVVATGVGLGIPMEAPSLVVQAILELLVPSP